jgi:hypothetical protein
MSEFDPVTDIDCAADALRREFVPGSKDFLLWGEIADDHQDLYRRYATRALEMIETPTDGVLDIGYDVLCSGPGETIEPEDFERAFRAVINAIIRQGQDQ